MNVRSIRDGSKQHNAAENEPFPNIYFKIICLDLTIEDLNAKI